MSTTTATEKGIVVGVERLVMWKLTADTSTSLTYDETAHTFEKTLMTFKDTPNVNAKDLSADNQIVRNTTMKNGGKLALGITGIDGTDKIFLYGHTQGNTAVKSFKTNIAPYVCVALMTNTDDGKVNLYKYPKAKFLQAEENSQSVQADGINYYTPTINGSYMPTIKDGMDCTVIYGLDPSDTTDAATITSWFGAANFFDTAAADNGE